MLILLEFNLFKCSVMIITMYIYVVLCIFSGRLTLQVRDSNAPELTVKAALKKRKSEVLYRTLHPTNQVSSPSIYHFEHFQINSKPIYWFECLQSTAKLFFFSHYGTVYSKIYWVSHKKT